MMKQYYTFDMTKLEDEVANLMNSQIGKISMDKEKKFKKIGEDFTKISSLAEQHIVKGSRFGRQANERQSDEQKASVVMEQFDKETKDYENIISEANTQKQKVRKEIANLES